MEKDVFRNAAICLSSEWLLGPLGASMERRQMDRLHSYRGHLLNEDSLGVLSNGISQTSIEFSV